SGTGSSLAGSVNGAGTLAFSGGSQALNSGLSLGVANWTLSNVGVATLNTALSYGGSFTGQTGATLSLNAKTLTLNGAASFNNASIAGNGALITNGATAITGSQAGSFFIK